MKRRNYIFTNKKHSKRAVMSAILGIISTASLCYVVYLAYRSGGEAPAGYGMTGLLAAVYSLAGLILGIIAVRDKDNYRFFPRMGVLLNLLALGGVSFLLWMGI